MITQKFLHALNFLSTICPWALLVLQLSVTWDTNPQYSHGYIIPFLCIYLLIKSPPSQLPNIEKNKGRGFPLQGKAYILIGIPALISLLPLWIIREANSDWRMINFAIFSAISLIMISSAYDQGGVKRTFSILFPLFFFFGLYSMAACNGSSNSPNGFRKKVSSIIVDIILLLGHEARLEGTVIDVGEFGQIGIDQACSGIQGFQASLVITLFLGAYFGFGFLNRLVFVLAGS